MALIPNDPREQRFFLGMLVLVALTGLYYYYLYTPGNEELQELEDRVEEIEFASQQIRARTGNLEVLRERLEQAEDLFERLETLVPPEAEVPVIYDAITSESQSLGLEILNVTPSTPQSPGPEAYYLRQNWSMEIEGPYHAVGEFLARVASFERIVRPDVSEIRPAGGGEGGPQVRVSMSLETFVLPPGAGPQAGGGDAAE